MAHVHNARCVVEYQQREGPAGGVQPLVTRHRSVHGTPTAIPRRLGASRGVPAGWCATHHRWEPRTMAESPAHR